MRELVINPYAGIDWTKVIRKIGDFHQHSTESDGNEYPSMLYDQMVEKGRDIACITDHDSYRPDRGKFPKVLAKDKGDGLNGRFVNTFPPSTYDKDVYFDPLSFGNYTDLARDGATGEFDRDSYGVMPNGLLAIEGNEVTAVGSVNGIHDFVSLFTNYGGLPEERTTYEALQIVKDIQGVSILAHPWKYSFSEKWYRENTRKYFPSCIGMEIDKGSIKFWDNILTMGLDIIPIWGFSNTDSHHTITNIKYNTIFMEELSETELKKRLIAGNFYSSFGMRDELVAPVITKIDVCEGTKKITIITNNTSDVVQWISCGHIVHIGNTLDYSKTKGISRYVRAVVKNTGGYLSLTNPFYFNRFVTPKFN